MKPVILSLFLAIATTLSAQSEAISQPADNILFEDQSVQVELQTEICSDPHSDLSFEYYVLKVSNKTNEKINLQFWSHGHENESSEFFHSLVLEPQQELQGTCEGERGSGLKFFRKDVGTADVRKLKLVDFNVHRL